MRIISKRILREYWEQPDRQDSEEALKASHQQTKQADWASPVDVKASYRNANILGDNRVCFNIAGNKYRLVVHIYYPLRIVYVKFVGTHAEYDRIDADTI